MAWKEGEVYRCPDGSCGCELTVTKVGNPDECDNQAPVCCCGKPMKKVS